MGLSDPATSVSAAGSRVGATRPSRRRVSVDAPVETHGKWIHDLPLRCERALCEPGRTGRHRRRQVGHDTQASEDIIGPYGRGDLPYDKVEYRTRPIAIRAGPPAPVRDRDRDHGGAGIERAHALLGEALHLDPLGGLEGEDRAPEVAHLHAGQLDPPP